MAYTARLYLSHYNKEYPNTQLFIEVISNVSYYDLAEKLANNDLSSLTVKYSNQPDFYFRSWLNNFVERMNIYRDNNYDNDYIDGGYPLRPVVQSNGISDARQSDFIGAFRDRRFKISLRLPNAFMETNAYNGAETIFLVWDFCFSSNITNLNNSFVSDLNYGGFCPVYPLINEDWDVDAWKSTVNSYKYNAFNSSNLSSELVLEEEEECSDNRTSEGTQMARITINGTANTGDSYSQFYNLLFQPGDSDSGTLTDIGFVPINSFTGASISFFGGNVRGNGIITVRGRIRGAYLSDNSCVPIDEECIIIQAVFEPCCDYPVSYSETVSDVLENINNGAGFDTISTCISMLEITSVEWSGFEILTDYCCDNVSCNDEESLTINEEFIKVEGGGGGETVDITCICEALENMNAILTDKLNSIKLSIDDINIDVDNTCICDNLEAIKQSIDDKDFTITVEPSEVTVTNPVNNITVEPCSPIVTNPVNNITVEPCSPIVTNPVNNITVEPSEVTVTNPVNNITVEPCSPIVTNPVNNITVEPSSIDSLSLNQDDLINKLDELFKTTVQKADGTIEEQDITEVLKNKELSSYNDTVIEPVNYAYSGRAKVDEDY